MQPGFASLITDKVCGMLLAEEADASIDDYESYSSQAAVGRDRLGAVAARAVGAIIATPRAYAMAGSGAKNLTDLAKTILDAVLKARVITSLQPSCVY